MSAMKRVIPILTIVAVLAVLMVSCKSKTTADATTMKYSDTLGLAQFQQWKIQNELAATEDYQKSAVATAPKARATSAVRRTSSGSRNNGTWSNTSESSNAAKAPAKKGWSKAAKGAVIGGVAGAVGGAVINKKNRGLGAVIGGVAGGAVGYGIGRHMDKKDGRY